VSSTSNQLNNPVKDEEFLYRGIIDINWDLKNNRPSSAAFKDSKGVSVDRSANRDDKESIEFLKEKKSFFAICKIQTGVARGIGAIVKYMPLDDNIYHSEIHDSTQRAQMQGSKPRKLRDRSELVYFKNS